MTSKTKTKKIVTPVKDVEVPVKFNSPLDMQEHVADKAPESAMQAPEEAVNERWRTLMTPMGKKATEWPFCENVRMLPDKEFERLYGELSTQLPEIQRAMLRELVRIRCALLTHFHKC